MTLPEHGVAEVARRASSSKPAGTTREQPIWLMFEPAEIIELKQVVLNRDAPGAADFFYRVIVPRVRTAARQRGVAANWKEKDEPADGCLSG